MLIGFLIYYFLMIIVEYVQYVLQIFRKVWKFTVINTILFSFIDQCFPAKVLETFLL